MLTPSSGFIKTQLPATLDNSIQQYFRPFYRQTTVECGQYSGIAFNFCYEINRMRDLPADDPANQYPAHYTFNFMNDGYGWHGVSYQHSWEIAKANGHMNVIDYGIDTGYNSRIWISGYEKYYNGMFNKVDETYQIKVGTPEGLLILKNWLHNHLDGSEVGGIASFYSGAPWNTTTLPAGTPEGGKHVIVSFDPHVGHANTIVGYNDSIRYDYNQDGQYTNDIDINNDGIIDMRDWEMGGLLFMDSYINGINWADSGFCYMMYKTLAEIPENGGIWNHAVHVVTTKEDYEPQLTIKFKIRYNCRDRIKLSAGVAQDPDATYPDHILGFPIFNFQGACFNMQGGNSPDSAILEAGLDVTPLLSHINKNEPARFFLLINEDDEEGWGNGELESFTLIDYTNEPQFYSNPQNPGEIVSNGLTLASVIASIDFNKPEITTEQLPLALTDEPYQYQLSNVNGKPPYKWQLLQKYLQTTATSNLPPATGNQIEFDDTLQTKKLVQLDFDFPFYNETFSEIYVHTDGFIMFDDQQYPWPYMYDEELMIRKTRIIAPFLNKYLYISEAAGNFVKYESTASQATIRWNMSSDKLNTDSAEFELRLFADGKIEFAFGETELFTDHNWASGISLGDEKNYTMALVSNNKKFPANQTIAFNKPQFVNELSLSKAGLLSGTPLVNYFEAPVHVLLTDDNNLSAEKQFTFTSWYAGTYNHQLSNNISVWPNPTKDKIHISAPGLFSGPVNIKLKDLQGKTVQLSKLVQASGNDDKFELILDQNLPNGVYLLEIQNHQTISTKKINVSR